MKSEQMQELVDVFMDNYKSDVNSRYRSYDYAFNAFRENYNHKDDNDKIDYVALNLFAYLGSWGMVCRGNFLMQKDYKFLIPVVKTLYNYYVLCEMDILSDNFDKVQFVMITLEAVEKLREHFIGVKYCKSDGKSVDNKNITDTVIGKILMVTLGCLPAYDEFVCYGMGQVDICQKLNKKSVEGLIDFSFKNKQTLKEISTKIKEEIKIEYPVMKILDMIFWEYGLKYKPNKKK